MGYKVLGAPVHTPEKLTYTLLRNMPIPMGTPNLGTSVTMGAPIPTPSIGSLNIEMKCKIELCTRQISQNPYPIRVLPS